MARIFLSYSRKDETFARRLATSLSDLGADVWIDLEDIPAGMKWSSAIQQGLDSGQVLIVIISPDSMISRNVEDEWQYYLDNQKPVIPVLLQPSKIHFQLSRIQYIDFSIQNYDQAFGQLYSELRRKGVVLNPLLSATERVHLPTPHQYPPQRPSHLKYWLAGGGIVAILAVLASVVGLLLLTNLNSNSTPVATDVQIAGLSSPSAPNTLQPTTPAPVSTIPVSTEIPVGYPGNPVTRNTDWHPVAQSFNGVDMVMVPAGCFMMGSTIEQINAAHQQCSSVYGQCDRGLFEDEQPGGQVCFERPFWIDRYEVTNAQYGSSGNFSGDATPRTNITWNDAQNHCQLRGGRLPTEAEWEYAARGTDNLIYPWGNNFDGSRLNYCDSGCEYTWHDTSSNDYYAQVAPVGSYPNGVSWVGALDLSGNVWEWTSTIYAFPYPYSASDGRENPGDSGGKRVLRGGSWNWLSADTRTAARDDYAGENISSDWYGFRCALDF